MYCSLIFFEVSKLIVPKLSPLSSGEVVSNRVLSLVELTEVNKVAEKQRNPFDSKGLRST